MNLCVGYVCGKDRVDEYNYKESIAGQEKLAFEKHWRKHTMSAMDKESNVSFLLLDDQLFIFHIL